MSVQFKNKNINIAQSSRIIEKPDTTIRIQPKETIIRMMCGNLCILLVCELFDQIEFCKFGVIQEEHKEEPLLVEEQVH